MLENDPCIKNVKSASGRMEVSGEIGFTHALNFMVIFLSGDASSDFKHQFSVSKIVADLCCVAGIRTSAART